MSDHAGQAAFNACRRRRHGLRAQLTDCQHASMRTRRRRLVNMGYVEQVSDDEGEGQDAPAVMYHARRSTASNAPAFWEGVAAGGSNGVGNSPSPTLGAIMKAAAAGDMGESSAQTGLAPASSASAALADGAAAADAPLSSAEAEAADVLAGVAPEAATMQPSSQPRALQVDQVDRENPLRPRYTGQQPSARAPRGLDRRAEQQITLQVVQIFQATCSTASSRSTCKLFRFSMLPAAGRPLHPHQAPHPTRLLALPCGAIPCRGSSSHPRASGSSSLGSCPSRQAPCCSGPRLLAVPTRHRSRSRARRPSWRHG